MLQAIPVNGLILSAQFWPSLREDKVELPAELQQALDRYTKCFEALKGNRTLNWKPHLGTRNWKPHLGTLNWKPYLGTRNWKLHLGTLNRLETASRYAQLETASRYA